MSAPKQVLPLLGLTVLFLSGCSLPPVEKAAQVPVQEPVLAQSPASSRTVANYRIDPATSSLHLLVFRGGPMGRLGHNHVISSASLQGRVWTAARVEDSGFEIEVPVNKLIVDDEAARAANGEDFAQVVSEDSKTGTKANMLRETLLDGARYPTIGIRSTGMRGTFENPTVVAAIRIKDQTREVQLPVSVRAQGGALLFKGAFTIRQTDFGITPLSVAGGALLVVDAVRIQFELTARPL